MRRFFPESAHGIHRDAESLDDFQTIALAIRDAFNHGADQIGARVACGQPEPNRVAHGPERNRAGQAIGGGLVLEQLLAEQHEDRHEGDPGEAR